MEKNISTAAEQTETAEVKKNPKIIELARPYKFDDKEYTEIDLSGLDGLTIKDAVLIIKKLYNEGELAAMITPETATAYTDPPQRGGRGRRRQGRAQPRHEVRQALHLQGRNLHFH